MKADLFWKISSHDSAIEHLQLLHLNLDDHEQSFHTSKLVYLEIRGKIFYKKPDVVSIGNMHPIFVQIQRQTLHLNYYEMND